MKNKTTLYIGLWLLVFLVGIFFMRINPRIGLILLIGSFFFLFQLSLLPKRKEERINDDTTRRIELKLEQCDGRLKGLDKEILEIENDIYDLKQKLVVGTDLNPQTIYETKKVLNGFRAELKLRRAKLTFFQTCGNKLQALLNNHRAVLDLNEKQERLKTLQENTIDDLSEVEAIESDLNYESDYLDTIDTLSLRMLDYNTLDLVQEIHTELQEKTRNLGNP